MTERLAVAHLASLTGLSLKVLLYSIVPHEFNDRFNPLGGNNPLFRNNLLTLFRNNLLTMIYDSSDGSNAFVP